MADNNAGAGGRAGVRRNFSPYEAFRRAGLAHRPRGGFNGVEPPEVWRDRVLPEVLATLGRLPEAVDPNPELLAEFEFDGVLAQRWLLDVQPELSVIAVVNRPASAGGLLPGLLCWGGHRRFGKETVMGNLSQPGMADHVALTGLNYGHVLAKAGFVTFAIDWMGQGDLDDSEKPNNREFVGKSDPCNMYYLAATLLGMTSLGINLSHGQRLTDFVCSLGIVDPDRIGVIGESYGGTLAVWTTLLDQRIRATEVICYSDSFADFALRDLNYCGSQITPGLFDLVDVAELQGLIAPRPLLTDIAVYDDCFLLPSAVECVNRVEHIYSCFGASDRFERQLFDCGHGWQRRESERFFTRYLAPRASAG